MSSTAVPPSKAAGPAAGARYVFLRTGEQTGGAHEVIEAFLPPGGEGPPAVHRQQQKLFVQSIGTHQSTVQIHAKRGCRRRSTRPHGHTDPTHG